MNRQKWIVVVDAASFFCKGPHIRREYIDRMRSRCDVDYLNVPGSNLLEIIYSGFWYEDVFEFMQEVLDELYDSGVDIILSKKEAS